MKRLMAGVSLIALSVAAAHAQTSAGADKANVAPTPAVPLNKAGTAKAAAGNAGSGGIEEVVVTASKVRVNAQKLATTVTSIDGKTLLREGVQSPQDLAKLVGGLQIEQNGAGSSIFIRGVGSRVLTSTQDPAVAFSVDGVYYSRTVGPSVTLFDLQRVEVVKGPQGTLYGRNATGGAVNIVTNKPTFNGLMGDLSVEYGNYNTVNTVGAVNIPIDSKLAVRLAGQISQHDGYLTDGYNDQEDKSARASGLWKPTDKLSVYLSGDFGHQGGQGASPVPIGPGGNNNALTTRFVNPSNPFVGPSDPRVNAFIQAASPPSALQLPFPGLYCVGTPLFPTTGSLTGVPAIPLCSYPLGIGDTKSNGFLNNNYYGSNLTVEDDLNIARLTVIGGYRGTDVDTRFQVDPTVQLQKLRSNQESLEVRLNSEPNSGRLRWLVGAFYLREDQSSSENVQTQNMQQPNPIAAPGSPLAASSCLGAFAPGGPGTPAVPGLCLTSPTVIENAFNIENKQAIDQSYAVFGEGAYSILKHLRLTAGVRYTGEDKVLNGGLVTSYYTVPAGVSTSYPSQGAVSFSNVSYRFGVQYDIAPRSMAYATYTTGFHAGGFNQGVEEGPNPYYYQPETVKQYAVGIKNRFFNNHVQLNVEAFLLNYDNYQVQSLGRVNDGSEGCSTLMIAAACPYTVRIDNAATARVRGVETDLIWQVTDNGTFHINALYNDANFTDFLQANPLTGIPANYTGLNLPGASKWTLTGGYSQVFPLPRGDAVVFDVNSQYRDGNWMWYQHLPGNYQKSFTRTDISITYQTPSARWSLTGYIRNIENAAVIVQGSPPDAITGVPFNNLDPPRTYGGILSYHF